MPSFQALFLAAVLLLSPPRSVYGETLRQRQLAEIHELRKRAHMAWHQGTQVERSAISARLNMLRDISRLWPNALREPAICMIADVNATLNLYKETQNNLLDCLKLRKKIYGRYNVRINQTLLRLTHTSANLGKAEEALAYARQAKRIVDRLTLKTNRRDYFSTYHWLSRVLSGKFRYTDAVPYAQKALFYSLSLTGSERIRKIDALLDLGQIHAGLDQVERARSYYKQAVDTANELFGPDAQLTIGAKREAATFLVAVSDYEQAAPLLEEVIELTKRHLGARSPELATQLARLGIIYQAQGDLRRAEDTFQDALDIRSEVLGQDHPLLATPLGHLADIQAAHGETAKALSVAQRALMLTESKYGRSHLAVAAALARVAALQLQQGAFAAAMASIDAAFSIAQALVGDKNHLLATLHQTKGAIQAARGEYPDALKSYLSAKEIIRDVFGDSHPLSMGTLEQIAALHVALGVRTETADTLKRASLIGESRLYQEGGSLPEERFYLLLASLERQEELLLTAVLRQPEQVELRQLALAVALLRHSRAAVQLREQNRSLAQTLDADGKKQLARLRSLRSLYAQRCFVLPTAVLPPSQRNRLHELEDEIDKLESLLAQKSQLVAARRRRPSLQDIVSSVQAAMPLTGLFVQFVQFQPYTLPGVAASEPRYLALLLWPEGRIENLDLGQADRIDAAAVKLWTALASSASIDVVHEAKRALYDLIVNPLKPWLRGRRQLILAPDGALHLVPFAVFAEGTEALLSELDISYVTSGIDLLPQPVAPRSARSVVVIADPLIPTAAPLPEILTLAPLPGARAEAQIISVLFSETRLFLGEEASEPALLSLKAPGILHIATHGLFLEEAATPLNRERGLKLRSQPTPREPLLRSALILAKGNSQVHLHPGNADDSSDGIVTALELSGMDLWGTQLVVLSACSSGRGQIRRGQGVYGLQRAVMAAGAETLITSLWKIDDTVAKEFMESFYKQLRAGADRIAALRVAAQSIRSRYSHPYYWASFIAIGRGGSLSGLGGP